jgi:hypothetical protein
LSVLEQQTESKPLSLFLIHSFVDHIEPLAKALDFAEKPIPYSARLGHILDDLVSGDYLERFVVFDDGFFPQTVYRLALRGRVKAGEHILSLPSGTADLARKVLAEAIAYRESTPQARAIQLLAPVSKPTSP